MSSIIDGSQDKKMFYDVLAGLWNQQPELFLEIVGQIIEEVELIEAIREGRTSEFVSKDEIAAILKR